jgi:hypothetical protein
MPPSSDTVGDILIYAAISEASLKFELLYMLLRSVWVEEFKLLGDKFRCQCFSLLPHPCPLPLTKGPIVLRTCSDNGADMTLPLDQDVDKTAECTGHVGLNQLCKTLRLCSALEPWRLHVRISTVCALFVKQSCHIVVGPQKLCAILGTSCSVTACGRGLSIGQLYCAAPTITKWP